LASDVPPCSITVTGEVLVNGTLVKVLPVDHLPEAASYIPPSLAKLVAVGKPKRVVFVPAPKNN
jgi:hypothetical protein